MGEVKAPIALAKNDTESVFFRTVLKKNVMERLANFCKRYETGMRNEKTGENYWDYGVGLQILLDFYEYQTQQVNTQVILERIDRLADLVGANVPPEDVEEKEEKEDFGEDIRGEKI